MRRPQLGILWALLQFVAPVAILLLFLLTGVIWFFGE